MKEIDFLPDWYKHSRRRKISYQTQYAVILAVLLVMAGWSFYTARSVSSAEAQVQSLSLNDNELKEAQKEYDEIETKLKTISEQKKVIEGLDTKLSIADVMAELSCIVDSRIVLTNVDIMAEQFCADDQGASGSVRVVRNSAKNASAGQVRFKLTLSGLAADAGDVADLIVGLEDSQYFDQVIPGYTRSKEMRDMKDTKVSEFQISCFIANYSQERK